MIEYVEVRNENLELIGILDTAQSVIWRTVYYGVGDFQIYIKLADVLAVLNDAKYISKPNAADIGIIESILIQNDAESGKMVTISGRGAKSILDRRLIYTLSGNSVKATVFRGNVAEAVRKLVYDNAINCTWDNSRDILELELGADLNIDDIDIIDENGAAAQKQVTCENLLTYTDALLQEYGLASVVVLEDGKLKYIVYRGWDSSSQVIFSREFDNLLSSEYSRDTTLEKNFVLVGGEGEGIDRFYVTVGSVRGLARKEVFVDASALKKEYEDESGVKKTYTNAEYTSMLKAHGTQSTNDLKVVEDFNGAIDVTNSIFVYGRDFIIGDIVSVQDNDIGAYKAVRIAEVTEYQDQDGYTVEVVYQGE